MRTLFALLMIALAVPAFVACDGSSTEAGAGAWEARTEAYPSAPFGIETGDRVANHTFTLPSGGEFTLDANVFKPGAKALLLVTAAEWCTACRDEAPKLQAIYDDYHEQGLEVVTAVFEDAESAPANASHAQTWIDLYDLAHVVVADPQFVMQQYYDPNNTPLIMVVDVDDMSIQYKAVGLAETNVRAVIDALL